MKINQRLRFKDLFCLIFLWFFFCSRQESCEWLSFVMLCHHASDMILKLLLIRVMILYAPWCVVFVRVVNERGHEIIHNLLLKSNAGKQFLSCGFVKDTDGTEYSLAHLQPYIGLFSGKHYKKSEKDKSKIIDTR